MRTMRFSASIYVRRLTILAFHIATCAIAGVTGGEATVINSNSGSRCVDSSPVSAA